MGQYYKPAMEINGEIKVFNRDVDGQYALAKLTENSWWLNTCVNAISGMMYKNPVRLVWCGDYADEESDELKSPNSTAERVLTFNDIWNIPDEKNLGLIKTDFTLDNKFLVNHDTMEYMDCNKYKKLSTNSNNWVMHPVSLLTAIGNGRGGGDYYQSAINSDKIGLWCWDKISIEDEAPIGYTETMIIFKEG
jgi:hypothetical protein